MKNNKLFYLWIIIYGIDYFTSYYAHNYINHIYETNAFLRYIFKQNIIIVIITFIIIQMMFYYIIKILEKIEKTIKIKYRNIITLTFFTTLYTLEIFTIIHNIMLALGG